MIFKNTFKKYKIGQSVAEYFILTAVVVTLFLFFTKSGAFISIKEGLDNMFNGSVVNITEVTSVEDSATSVEALREELLELKKNR